MADINLFPPLSASHTKADLRNRRDEHAKAALEVERRRAESAPLPSAKVYVPVPTRPPTAGRSPIPSPTPTSHTLTATSHTPSPTPTPAAASPSTASQMRHALGFLKYYQSPELVAQIRASNTPFVESPALADQRSRYRQYVRASKSVLLDESRILPRLDSAPLTPEAFSAELQAINSQYRLNVLYLLQYRGCGHCLHPVIGSPEEAQARELAGHHTPRWLVMGEGCPFCQRCLMQSASAEAGLPPVRYYRLVEASSLRKRAWLLGSSWAGTLGDVYLVSHLARSCQSRGYLVSYEAYYRFTYAERTCLNFAAYVDVIDRNKTLSQVVEEYDERLQAFQGRKVSCEDFHNPLLSAPVVVG
jgi:hypothetical protein